MKSIFGAIFKFITNRMFILLIIVAILFYILLARLFELQIIKGKENEEAFELRIVREVAIEGQRGNIYDRNGYPLAENIIAYNVLLNDSYEVDDKNKMLYELIKTIEKNDDTIINDFPIQFVDGVFIFDGTDKQFLNFKKNIFNRSSTNKLKENEVKMSVPEMYAYIIGEKLFEIDQTIYTTADTLAILNIRYAQYIIRYSKYKPKTIALNICDDTLALLEEKKDVFPGITIIESPYRVYNDAPYFAHIIGYTRAINSEKLEILKPLGYTADDIVGVIGIEEKLELYLRGYDGYQKVEVNQLGKKMLVIDEVESVMGYDVYLTLDRNLQIDTYNILEQQLADILVDKMRQSLPSSGEQRYILLKDIFDSIFRYSLIDTKLITENNSDYENNIVNTMLSKKESLSQKVIEEINQDSVSKDYKTYGTVYTYMLDDLKKQGILDINYKLEEDYTLFVDAEISFVSLLKGFYKNNYFILPESVETQTEETVIEYIKTYLTKECLTQYDFVNYIYLYLIDQEAFNYIDLTMMIIEQNLVSATEDEVTDILRRRLSPLEFMKVKIANIEITPHELALDPSSGSVVISDIDTGEILALVSYPTYDNSRLVNEFDNQYYTSLLNDPTSPLYPRATFSKSAPGSTFKMVAAMAALEEGVIGPKEYIYATGYFDKIFPAARCWINSQGGQHGLITIEQALEVSCNFFFYELGYRLSTNESGKYVDSQGITTLEEYASRFGLDSKTGIEIGDSNSNIADRDAVRATIGQGTHNYTPVQLARYMNTLANDGVMKELGIVDKVLDKNGDLVMEFTPEVLRTNNFNQDNIDLIKSGMLAVTEGSRGTARSYFSDLPIQIAGKTGTAELLKTRASHAIFTGFAPYADPEISVVTVIQFGYSSKYAALNSKKVFARYFEIDKELTRYSTDHMLD